MFGVKKDHPFSGRSIHTLVVSVRGDGSGSNFLKGDVELLIDVCF